MKKLFAAVLASSMLLAGCASKPEQKQVNVYSYGPAIPQEVMDNFTAETGIKVNVKESTSDEEIYEALKKNDGSEYDLIIVDDYIIEPMAADGLLENLDTAKFENYENIDPIYQGQYFDEKDEYTIPYGAGVQAIIYNTDLVDIDIKGFDDLLNPALKDSIGITDNGLIMMGLSLISNGESVSESDLAIVDAAGEKLLQMAPNTHSIQVSGVDESLLSEEVSVGLTYTFEINNVMAAAKENGMNFKIVYPQEGVGYGIMEQAIPKNAPNKEEAYQLIDYMLQGEVAKLCIENVGFSANLKANELYTDDEKASRTFPKDFDVTTLQIMKTPSAEAMDARVKWFNEFKNACQK